MKLFRTLLLLVVTCLTSTAQVPFPTAQSTEQAIEAFVETSNSTPKLGEPFTLTFTVRTTKAIELASWVALVSDDTLTVIEELPQLRQETTEYITFIQSFRVVLWQTGIFLTPAYEFVYSQQNSLSQYVMPSLSIYVPSLLTAPDEMPRPSLLPVDLPYTPTWIYFLPIGFIFLLLVIFIYNFRKNNLIYNNINDTLQIALAQLDELNHNKPDSRLLYPTIGNIIRTYIAKQFHINAQEMTSQELLGSLQKASFEATLLRELKPLLEQVDLVKFAKFVPDTDSDRFISYAIHWLKKAHSTELSGQEVTLG